MKRLVLLCSAVLLTAIFFFSHLQKQQTLPETVLKETHIDAVPSSEGTPQDPRARPRYEWLKVRNPQTGQVPANIRARELEFANGLPTREEIAALAKSTGSESAITTWNHRGPYNLGGRTRAVAYDVTNANVVNAGGVSGGMWRTTNEGSTWTKTTDESQLHSVTCIAQDTRSGSTSTWYYGTGEYRGNTAGGYPGSGAVYRGDGISKSTNSGASWTHLTSTASGTPHRFDSPFDFVWNIAIDPSNTSQAEVYAATYGRIYRSTNGGTSWTSVHGQSPDAEFTDVAVTSTGVVYTAFSSGSPGSGIRRSSDGVTFTNITPSLFPATYGRMVIAVAPTNENIVYFLVVVGSGHQLWMYNSTSGTWVNRSANLPPGFDSQEGYDLVIEVRPVAGGENFVLIGGVALYRSTDGFATAHNGAPIGGPLFDPQHHADQHAFVFRPGSSSAGISAHDGGLSRTTDISAATVSWTSLSNGYLTTQFYAVALDHTGLATGANVIIGGTQDNGSWWVNSSSGTASWLKWGVGDGGHCAIAISRTSYYFSSQNGRVERRLLTDNGDPIGNPSFTRVDPAGAANQLFINPFVLHPTLTNRMFYAGGDRIWRNSDLTAIPLGGLIPTSVNWTQIASTVLSGRTICALEHSSNAPSDRLYFGTTNGQVYRLDGSLGASPTLVDVWTGKGFPSDGYVSSIATDFTDGNKALLAFSNYEIISLYYTTNGGSTWSAVAGNLEQFGNGQGNGPSVRWVEIVMGRNNLRYYFAGTSTGLYSTETLNGTSTVWVQEGSTTIGNVVVDMIDSRQSEGVVAVGTHGAGVFSGQVPLPLPVDDDRSVPLEYALHQNYPNPFNPATNIEFTLPVSGHVSLKVFDMTGREVATLIDKDLNPGRYEKQFNGSGLASGVYFYRLASAEFVQTKKMIVAK